MPHGWGSPTQPCLTLGHASDQKKCMVIIAMQELWPRVGEHCNVRDTAVTKVAKRYSSTLRRSNTAWVCWRNVRVHGLEVKSFNNMCTYDRYHDAE